MIAIFVLAFALACGAFAQFPAQQPAPSVVQPASQASLYLVQGPLGPEPANRPPAKVLEAMRDLEDLGARYQFARELAAAGYVIDVPVDVFQWDYAKTMAQRRAYGYAWVPAAGMRPILLPPGLSFPGLPKYDPDKPPIGAILVPKE